MIQCPNCGANLPDRVRECSFCQERFDPDLLVTNPTRGFQPAKWVVTAYYAVSGYIIFSGLLDLIEVIHSILASAHAGSATDAAAKEIALPFQIIPIIFAVFTCFLGLGLALRIEFVRGIANFLCGIEIILGLISFPLIIGAALIMGPFGPIIILLRALNIAANGFMIYLIGETDSRAPNI